MDKEIVSEFEYNLIIEILILSKSKLIDKQIKYCPEIYNIQEKGKNF